MEEAIKPIFQLRGSPEISIELALVDTKRRDVTFVPTGVSQAAASDT
jgi:hypothetical protein